jgi:hypothetical protein
VSGKAQRTATPAAPQPTGSAAADLAHARTPGPALTARSRTVPSSLGSAPARSRSRLRSLLRLRFRSPAFTALQWTSLFHSCIYLSLLLCAFALGKPQPQTFVLGMTHGLLWIGMSLACIAAARLRIVSLRLAVAVAVLGGVGPFFGSFEFLREQRRRSS